MAVVMPTKLPLRRPPPLSLPLHEPPTTDPQSNTPGSGKRRRPFEGYVNTTSGESELGDEVPKAKYECRFCNVWFEKSQALGGHMNRHRQERETEQYHHAHQLLNSLAQQQMPRTWTTCDSLSIDQDVGRTISTNFLDHASISPGGSYYLPTNSPSSNIQPTWNLDRAINPNLAPVVPRPGPTSQLQSSNAHMDTMTASGCMHNDFMSSALQQQPCHNTGSFECPGAPCINNPSTTALLLNSRAGLCGTTPGICQEPALLGGSNVAAGTVPLGLDHQNLRLNVDALRQLLNASLNQATLMQSSNVDVRPAPGMRAHLSSTVVHDLNILQADFETSNAGEIVQAQYAASCRVRMPRTSSGSVASGSFESFEPAAAAHGVGAYVGATNVQQPTGDSESGADCRLQLKRMTALENHQLQQILMHPTSSVVQNTRAYDVNEVVDGNNDESAKSGNVSCTGMSGPLPRY